MTTKRLIVALCVLTVVLSGCSVLPGDGFTNPTTPVTWVPETTVPASTAPTETAAPTTAPAEPIDLVAAYVDSMTLEEQVAQMLLIRCPGDDAARIIRDRKVGGIILFGQDTKGQTPDSLRNTLKTYQAHASVPLIVAVDEEGGTVNRISSNSAFRSEPFPSPRSVYVSESKAAMLDVEAEKSNLLRSLGINLNLAPVCDVVTEDTAFLADRSLRQSPQVTGELIADLVRTMQRHGVGATLKHFPGYGNCDDTHIGMAVDDRSLESLKENDLVPFRMGIQAGAGAVMVCHNIVNSIDPMHPASLSPEVHKLLREELGFDGVIMTDDLIMDAISERYDAGEAAVLAVLAGNDMLITSWSTAQYEAILEAIDQGRINPERIRESAMRIISWKVSLGVLELN